MGYFPHVARTRPVAGAIPRRYEMAEILDLQALRAAGRRARTVNDSPRQMLISIVVTVESDSERLLPRSVGRRPLCRHLAASAKRGPAPSDGHT